MPNDNPAPVNPEEDPLIGLDRPYGHMTIRASRLAHLRRTDPESFQKMTNYSRPENANGSQ